MNDHSLTVDGFWISVAAFIVALVAMPTIFQMLWGGPRITYEHHRDQEQDTSLIVVLRNSSISSKLLLRLGVLRQAASIRCSYVIVDRFDCQVAFGQQLIRFSNREPVVTGQLGEYDWAALYCITQDRNAGIVYVGQEDDADDIRLREGVYTYRITLHYSGKHIFIDKNFEVKRDNLEWRD